MIERFERIAGTIMTISLNLESWILQLKNLDNSLFQAYSPSGINSITPEALKTIEHLIDKYNFLVSLSLNRNVLTLHWSYIKKLK
jgi:hypothetical protein